MVSAEDLLKQLNPAQAAAVSHHEGPVMIIAGAGSGKTRVLTYRIAHLIQQGVPPYRILALTFTNKAAREMKNRIMELIGPTAHDLWMGTFHSIFARVLRTEAEHLGFSKTFTIYDTDDSRSLIKSLVKEKNLVPDKYKPALVHARISAVKNRLISPKDYAENQELMRYDQYAQRPFIYDIYNSYQNRLFQSNAMDFDDLLVNTHEMLIKHLDLLNKYQHKFNYILVDEFQDTNTVQYSIIRKMAAAHRNICVVGDDAQSIYAFRGATIQNILNFASDYPDLAQYKLEQNYRSTQIIVKASGTVIKRNQKQLEKALWTENEEGPKIKVIKAATDNEEGKLVAESIFEEKMVNRLGHDKFAILYRTNAQSRALEEALRKLNIPYRIFGGTSFYQRKEVKDALAYFRLVLNQKDSEALKRIINFPTRGIGKTSIDKMMDLAVENERSIWEIAEKANEYPDLRNASSNIKKFVLLIKRFQQYNNENNAAKTAELILRESGLMKEFEQDDSYEGTARLDNIKELLNGIIEFTENDTEEGSKDLETFMQDIALLTDADIKPDDDTPKVSLMTIHAAKGLEFPYVYVVGMEENLFPSSMAMEDQADIEEERRLFYVAITRAEQRLFLSFAASRNRYGSFSNNEPSRFLAEIDANFLEFSFYRGAGSGNSNILSEPTDKRAFILPRKPAALTPAPAPIANFEPSDNNLLEAGMRIEHQRFGKGLITIIDGQGPDRRASINFDDYGEKTLVLRFAKLRIL